MQGEKVIIDLGQVQPIKGVDYYTSEEVQQFENTIANAIKENLDSVYETTENKTNELNENSTSEQYPNAQITYKEFNKRDKELEYVSNCNKGFINSIKHEQAEGESVTLTDCSNLPLNDFKLKGVDNGVVTGDITVKVRGVNMLDPANFQEISYISYNATNSIITINANSNGTSPSIFRDLYLPAGTYTIYTEILEGTYTGGNLLLYANDSTKITEYRWYSTPKQKIVANNGIKVIQLWKPTATTDIKIKFWIVKGDYSSSEMPTYEPYTEQTQLLSLGSRELTENDTIQKYNNQWCINTTSIEDTTLTGQLDNLMKIRMNKGTTNIFTTTEDDNPILEINYTKDLNTITKDLETRLELLET